MIAKVCLLALALLCAASAAPDNRVSRITGGTPISITEFPYAAALLYHYPGPQITIQRCVGAIVSSYHVITTAFCFTGANLSNLSVRAGSTNSMAGGLVVGVNDAVLHPYYVQNPRQNDIAILFLSSPLPIGLTINTLLLPPQDSYISDYQIFKVVSWGFESEQGPQLDSLKSIYLDYVDLLICSYLFDEVEDVWISDTVLCGSRYGNYGTCFGDSGAPMVINNVLVGVASQYHECGTNYYPDVFTRVDRYTNWIMSVAQSPRDRSDNYVPVRVANA